MDPERFRHRLIDERVFWMITRRLSVVVDVASQQDTQRSRCTDPFRHNNHTPTHTTLRSVKLAAKASADEPCNLVPLARSFVLGNAAEGNFSCFQLHIYDVINRKITKHTSYR